MGFLRNIGKSIAGSAGSILSGGMGLIGGAVNGAAAAKRQYEHEKEMMGLQHQYNEQSANAAQERAKDMWNYTNYEAQVEHMRNAGLSVGLMYGNGGGMGASSSGAQGQGVTNPGSQAEAIRAQHTAMGIQLANVASQTRLNEAQAKKAENEAKKTAGVDTEFTEASVKKLIEETKNEKLKQGLVRAQTRVENANEDLIRASTDMKFMEMDEIKATIQKTIRESERILKEIDGAELDNKLKKETMEAHIQQEIGTAAQILANITKTQAETKAINQAINESVERINQKWNELDLEWIKTEQGQAALEQEAQRIINQMNQWSKEMELKKKQFGLQEETFMKDTVLGVLKIATNAAMLSRGIPVAQ